MNLLLAHIPVCVTLSVPALTLLSKIKHSDVLVLMNGTMYVYFQIENVQVKTFMARNNLILCLF